MELQDEAQELITLADLVPVPLSDPIAVRLRMSGECRLLWAVLEDGIACYLRYVDHPSAVMRDLFQEANDWIEATEGEGLCSFRGICGAFQIDPDYLRRGLRRRLREIREQHALVLLNRAA
jgi:GNAT superfamily N-acetyltransferase